MPARSERARRRRSSAASASAAGVRAAGAATAAAAGGGGLRSRDSGAGRALLTERTRSGRRRAVDLAPRLFCIAWGRELGIGVWGRGGATVGKGRLRRLGGI
jgi:hypothetical protein